jgi:hypothetical protein
MGKERNIALTANHVVQDHTETIEEPGTGPLEVWAMPAEKFDGLNQGDKFSVSQIEAKGAVHALGYHSLQAERAMVHDDEPGWTNRPNIML